MVATYVLNISSARDWGFDVTQFSQEVSDSVWYPIMRAPNQLYKYFAILKAGNSSTEISGSSQIPEGEWRGGCALLYLHRFFPVWDDFNLLIPRAVNPGL